jgi:hypothetical protein
MDCRLGALDFDILAGRVGDSEQSQAVHEQLLLGVALGLSSLLLMFAVHTLLATYGVNRRAFLPAQRIIMVATSLIGPVVVVAVQFSNALDIEGIRLAEDPTTECRLGGLPDGVWINLAITTVGLVALAVTALAAVGVAVTSWSGR